MDETKQTTASKLASLLKFFRQRAKMTQPDLAQQAGISPSMVFRTEKSLSVPAADDYANMLSACGVDLVHILERVAAAQDAGRQVKHWERVSNPLEQVFDELGEAVQEEKEILIAMDRYGLFAGETDPATARKKIIETWWGLRRSTHRD